MQAGVPRECIPEAEPRVAMEWPMAGYPRRAPSSCISPWMASSLFLYGCLCLGVSLLGLCIARTDRFGAPLANILFTAAAGANTRPLALLG